MHPTYHQSDCEWGSQNMHYQLIRPSLRRRGCVLWSCGRALGGRCSFGRLVAVLTGVRDGLPRCTVCVGRRREDEVLNHMLELRALARGASQTGRIAGGVLRRVAGLHQAWLVVGRIPGGCWVRRPRRMPAYFRRAAQGAAVFAASGLKTSLTDVIVTLTRASGPCG